MAKVEKIRRKDGSHLYEVETGETITMKATLGRLRVRNREKKLRINQKTKGDGTATRIEIGRPSSEERVKTHTVWGANGEVIHKDKEFYERKKKEFKQKKKVRLV